MSKKAAVKFTPIVPVQWVKVNEPDTKYNPEGVFSIDAVLDPENNPEHEQFVEEVERLTEEMADSIRKNEPKKKRWKNASRFKEELNEEGDPTGRVVCKFKQNATFTAKKTGKTYTIENIPVIDSGLIPLDKPQIGNGSLCKIKFEVRPYGAAAAKELGMTMDLKAVQLIKLESYSGGDTAGFGEEEGYRMPDDSKDGFSSEPSDSDTDDGDDF